MENLFKQGDYIIHKNYPLEIQRVLRYTKEDTINVECVYSPLHESLSLNWYAKACNMTKIEVTELEKILWSLK
jgi:hypothetical protein